MNVECRANIVISTLKDKYTPEKTLCYCPAWTAGKKKGLPEKECAQEECDGLCCGISKEEAQEESKDVL